MKHRVRGKHLNRSQKHRQSLFKNLIISLIKQGQIKTTLAKAKAVRPLVDKLITRAKNGTLHSRRLLFSFLHQKPAVNKLVDEISPRFKNRTSGFTRIVRLGQRKGDNALMASLEFVDSHTDLADKKPKKKKATKKIKKTIQQIKSITKTTKSKSVTIQTRATTPRTTHK